MMNKKIVMILMLVILCTNATSLEITSINKEKQDFYKKLFTTAEYLVKTVTAYDTQLLVANYYLPTKKIVVERQEKSLNAIQHEKNFYVITAQTIKKRIKKIKEEKKT